MRGNDVWVGGGGGGVVGSRSFGTTTNGKESWSERRTSGKMRRARKTTRTPTRRTTRTTTTRTSPRCVCVALRPADGAEPAARVTQEGYGGGGLYESGGSGQSDKDEEEGGGGGRFRGRPTRLMGGGGWRR